MGESKRKLPIRIKFANILFYSIPSSYSPFRLIYLISMEPSFVLHFVVTVGLLLLRNGSKMRVLSCVSCVPDE